ncbi:DNA polymerase IV [Dehalogenimonas alkenigignens]|uniref:DNA polymerase IV n=1 Tax=Dehalogenimonas alkenigignens TaxID=1217799 RepID=A0A0W0GGI3_9CHLR|nr:DNA polymerase IV [Dehalogenimonas alkenigignens]KTB47672.1 Nucleotidyltransferase/DNA polymerase involved in DNA repair [Dehalogenimonas alkenigignens]PVV84059.1 DNA polymerase IV [Dehalogenimonas alkenigignens]
MAQPPVEKPRRIMHIDLDAFFVSVEQVFDPSLRGKPVAVGGVPGKGRGVVTAASYEARRYGIHAGMPLSQAHRLCPNCLFVPGRWERYGEASKRFMAILADFSPFLEPGGLDEAWLDVTGFESLHGSLAGMGTKIRRRIRDEIGIAASIGIAGSKIAAKVASKTAKPDGLVEVPPGGEAAFMAPLPIGRMPGVGEKTEKVLNALGIRTLGELASIPLDSLTSRFGAYGEMLKLHAQGIDRSRVQPPAEARSISAERTFDADSRDRQFLEATLRYLSEQIGARLRRYGQKASVVHIRVRWADFSAITRQRTLGFGTDSNEVIFGEALKLLGAALAGSRQPVRLLGVGLAKLSGGEGQMPLDNGGAARLSSIDRALDRIRKKYGFGAIQTGRTLALGRRAEPPAAGDS